MLGPTVQMWPVAPPTPPPRPLSFSEGGDGGRRKPHQEKAQTSVPPSSNLAPTHSLARWMQGGLPQPGEEAGQVPVAQPILRYAKGSAGSLITTVLVGEALAPSPATPRGGGSKVGFSSGDAGTLRSAGSGLLMTKPLVGGATPPCSPLPPLAPPSALWWGGGTPAGLSAEGGSWPPQRHRL